MSPHLAFLTPTALSLRPTTSLHTSISSPCPSPTTPSRRPARIICAVPTAKETGKKKAPMVFAKDMKGNFVWQLRAATEEDDIGVLTELLKNSYPQELIASFISDSGSCMVCEASVKGTKEGEGYSGRILGVVLLDVMTMVKDVEKGFQGGLVKKAELYTTAVHPETPTRGDVRSKLILGALKKLKGDGVVQASISIEADDESSIQLFKDCFFKTKDKEDGRINLVCDLLQENPDPQKKVM